MHSTYNIISIGSANERIYLYLLFGIQFIFYMNFFLAWICVLDLLVFLSFLIIKIFKTAFDSKYVYVDKCVDVNSRKFRFRFQ